MTTSMSLTVDVLKRFVTFLSPSQNLIAAFGYGSVVFPQYNSGINDRLVDVVLIVRDPLQWHTENIKNNPNHYNILLRSPNGSSGLPSLFRNIISHFPGPQVYYNPFVKWYDLVSESVFFFKYGVVSLTNVLSDLQNWSNLYIAGRLHKPVLWIHGEPSPDSVDSNCVQLFHAQEQNLTSALAFALLQLPLSQRNLTELDLFTTIASISYLGDWRMLIGEDKHKIKRLVTAPKRLSEFRRLYADVLANPRWNNAWGFGSAADTSGVYNDGLHFSDVHISDLATLLLDALPDSFCLAATLEEETQHPVVARKVLKDMSSEERKKRLHTVAVEIVCISSLLQTGLGLYSAGPVRSVRYASAKLKKMLVSMFR